MSNVWLVDWLQHTPGPNLDHLQLPLPMLMLGKTHLMSYYIIEVVDQIKQYKDDQT